MKNKRIFLLGLSALMLLAASCEKAVFDEQEKGGEAPATVRLTLSVSGVDIVPFDKARLTRASAGVGDYCRRLSFAAYSGSQKVKQVNQTDADTDFGTVSMELQPGTYQVLALAHSSNGNPTLTNVEKIQFTNDMGYSDTFFYYGTVIVEDSESVDLILERATSMFTLVTSDVKPASVRRMRFYYTGGSGALNAQTGYGCVNSKQTVFVDTDETTDGKALQLSVYTILKEQTGKLQMQVTAYDATANVLYDHEFADVPMERNKITRYTGTFFTTESPGTPDDNQTKGGKAGFGVSLNPEWTGFIDHQF